MPTGEFRGPSVLRGIQERGLGWILTVFAIGAAWGAITLQLSDMRTAWNQTDTRLAHIEQYLERSTHGDFVPTDPPMLDPAPAKILKEGMRQ